MLAQLRLRARATFALTAWVLCGGAHAQTLPDFEKPPVNYSTTAPRDAFVRFQARIEKGEFAFMTRDKHALQAVLAELNVPVESQMLVFSRTSLQRGRIRPERPRALYYSEDVYVGWVPGGLIEIAAIDPQLGPVFYSLELPTLKSGSAHVARDPDCLRCHGGTFVRDIPGVFARSVFPSRSGEPVLQMGSSVVDDQTPFEERWGGWYVTGYHGETPHRGNAFVMENGGRPGFEPSTKRPEELGGFFDADDYLLPTSDVVALLVFEHQMAVQNAFTHAALTCRRMLEYQKSLQETFKEPVTSEPVYDSVKSVFASSTQAVLDRLLFHDEAPLPDGVVGSDAFRAAFAKSAVRSASGHSLRDFSLKGRIFENRCSYLIYSAMFRSLPEPLKASVLDRLHEVLTGRERTGRYAHLGAAERRRIREILVETHPDAKARWETLASERP